MIETIVRDPTVARASRGASLLEPVTKMARLAAARSTDASSLVPLWYAMEHDLTSAAASMDFVDHTCTESKATKAERQLSLQDALAKRKEQLLQDAHVVAFVLDPRRNQLVQDVLEKRVLSSPKYDIVDIYAKSKVTAHTYIRTSFEAASDKLRAVAELDQYLARTGPWTDVVFPSPEEVRDLASWCKARAPAKLLPLVAVRVARVALTSGAAELSWARMTRDSVPIRNALDMRTEELLVDLSTNGGLLQGHADSQKLERPPGKPVLLDLADAAGHLLHDGDPILCDRDASSSSLSSSSTSGSEDEDEAAEGPAAAALRYGCDY